MTTPARAPRLMPLYQLFMLALCILALAGIVAQHALEDIQRLGQAVEQLATRGAEKRVS